jgi:hypothetical protein
MGILDLRPPQIICRSVIKFRDLATVITNLLSAVPVFGKDLVELIWERIVLIANLKI